MGLEAVPAPVAAVAAGRPTRQVWLNMLGGRTFEVGANADRCFVKWTPAASGINLADEASRMRWAAPLTVVPQVIGQGADDAGSWLVTSPLPGEQATSPRWRADPATAVAAIGRGLREMHDAMPVKDCPFSWMAEDRLADTRCRASEGRIAPDLWHEEYQPLGIDHALDLLADIPPVDRLVVCHGDSCSPNTLINEDGSCSGHVDLGELGVADRWADLAVATWSTEWNYGPGWEELLLSAYGVPPDPDRTRYYRLLWDLGP
jgi:aminoglycoside phosphotransferase